MFFCFSIGFADLENTGNAEDVVIIGEDGEIISLNSHIDGCYGYYEEPEVNRYGGIMTKIGTYYNFGKKADVLYPVGETTSLNLNVGGHAPSVADCICTGEDTEFDGWDCTLN